MRFDLAQGSHQAKKNNNNTYSNMQCYKTAIKIWKQKLAAILQSLKF